MIADIVLAVLAPVALLLSALLSAAHSALLAVSRADLDRYLREDAEAPRERVLRLHEFADRTLATLSLGRLLMEMTSAVAITLLIAQWLAEWWAVLLVAIAVMVVLAFVVTSVSPRAVGRRDPARVFTRLSGLVSAAEALLGPLSRLLVSAGGALVRGGSGADGPYAVEAELRRFVDRATEAKALEYGERNMIQGVIDLGETRIREIMVPRTDMVAIAANASAKQALRLFLRSGFSRLPVIGEDVDDLVGLLYLKDVIKEIHNPWDPGESTRVRSLVRPAVFIPESAHADDVLKKMQADHVHAAMIVDEYGGISGMVTIEDIIEEIVGEIDDEYDADSQRVEPLGDGRYRVPARESISEVGELFGLDVDDDNVDTIGGLLATALGRVPVPGAEASSHGIDMVAETTRGRRKRLATIVVARAPREDTGEDEDE